MSNQKSLNLAGDLSNLAKIVYYWWWNDRGSYMPPLLSPLDFKSARDELLPYGVDIMTEPYKRHRDAPLMDVDFPTLLHFKFHHGLPVGEACLDDAARLYTDFLPSLKNLIKSYSRAKALSQADEMRKIEHELGLLCLQNSPYFFTVLKELVYEQRI